MIRILRPCWPFGDRIPIGVRSPENRHGGIWRKRVGGRHAIERIAPGGFDLTGAGLCRARDTIRLAACFAGGWQEEDPDLSYARIAVDVSCRGERRFEPCDFFVVLWRRALGTGADEKQRG